MALWIAAIMLAVAVALFVAAPLTEPLRESSDRDDLDAQRLLHERGLATQALRELDFDHAMNKVEDGEFQALRQRLEARALAAMVGLDQMRGGNKPISSNACPQCGAPPAKSNQRFCTACGCTLLACSST